MYDSIKKNFLYHRADVSNIRQNFFQPRVRLYTGETDSFKMSLKTKLLLKEICKYVYYAGAGNCWYDDTYKESILYKIYTTVSFAIYTIMILLENLAALLGDFPEIEKNSAVMFSAIHNIVLTKMFLILYHKRSIKRLNYEMATVGEIFEEENVMIKQQRKVKFSITLYAISVYLSLIAYGVESMRKTIVEGKFILQNHLFKNFKET